MVSPKVCDWSVTHLSALRNHFPGYSGITDMKTALLFCSRKFCRLRYVEQTNLYLKYLPKFNDLMWIFTYVPSCEVPRSLGGSAPVSEVAAAQTVGVILIIVEASLQLVPHDGRHAVSPCRTLPGWKVGHELEVATACHLL